MFDMGQKFDGIGLTYFLILVHYWVDYEWVMDFIIHSFLHKVFGQSVQFLQK